jgi:GNAT superfamily N-acetyltransferase
MASVDIRELGPEERGVLLEMYRTFEPLGAAQGVPPLSEEIRISWIERLLKEAVNYGAFVADGQAVAHCILAASGGGGESEIAFFVHQDYRQRRIGTRLVERALTKARELGHGRVWATVLADNVPALRLLRGQGFAPSYVSLPTVEMDFWLPASAPALR